MPKPILSDSLFNADDVATAVLNKANLSVTNQDFAVVDRIGLIDVMSGWNFGANSKMYSFNGFMFFQLQCNHPGETPSDNEIFFQLNDSNFYPIGTFQYNTASYQGDSAYLITINTSGEFKVSNPINPGTADFYLVFGGMYRFT